MDNKQLAVVGCGVVGLPAAFMFAHSGLNVLGVDTDTAKITALQGNMFPLPKDLEMYRNLVGERLWFDTTFAGDIDYVVVCVGVGIDENNDPDFVGFDSLIDIIAQAIKSGITICFETTLPPGTMAYRVKPRLEQGSGMTCGKDFFLVYAPERVTLERLVYNMENMPRVVGGYSDECRRRGVDLYQRICKMVRSTDLTTAEVAKLVENTYRDVNIAYANEVAAICDSCDVDFIEVRDLVNALPDVPGDAYINPVRNLHFAGVGVGGYCLPKDPHLLRAIKPRFLEYSVIETSRKFNDAMPGYIADRIFQIIINSGWAQTGGGYDVLFLGYAAIKNTGDCRNTPAVPLRVRLKNSQLIRAVRIFDPFVPKYADGLSLMEKNPTVIVLVTPHDKFDVMFPELMPRLKSKRVILNRGYF